MRSREIIEILADVAKATSQGCNILWPTDLYGGTQEIECPPINYVFGDSRYVKERLDEMSVSELGTTQKFPLIALFCPFKEERNSTGYYSRASVRVLIACATRQQYSNEQRLVSSFENILRPIYSNFLGALMADGRFDFGYDEHIDHEYSENYSYGRYGAYDSAGDKVSEPIDAINITNLKLIVKNPNCREYE